MTEKFSHFLISRCQLIKCHLMWAIFLYYVNSCNLKYSIIILTKLCISTTYLPHKTLYITIIKVRRCHGSVIFIRSSLFGHVNNPRPLSLHKINFYLKYYFQEALQIVGNDSSLSDTVWVLGGTKIYEEGSYYFVFKFFFINVTESSSYEQDFKRAYLCHRRIRLCMRIGKVA